MTQEQGKYSEAEALYRRALLINEKALGKQHPYVAANLSKLTVLYFEQGKYAEAESLFQHVLQISEKALGKSHPYTIAIKRIHEGFRKKMNRNGWLSFLSLENIRKWLGELGVQ